MRTHAGVALAIPAVLLTILVVTGIYAAANYAVDVQVINTGDDSTTDIAIPLPLLGYNLMDRNYMTPDALNTAVFNGTRRERAMPPSARNIPQAVLLIDSGSVVDQTGAARGVPGDVILLEGPLTSPDWVQIGFHSQARGVHVVVTRAGVGSWTVIWEHFNGTNWTALPDVNDPSNSWFNLGTHLISWGLPTVDWPRSFDSGYTAYWVRGRVASGTLSTRPVAQRLWYETGMWWVAGNLKRGAEEIYRVELGGDARVSAHPMFVGTDGLVTTNDATMQPTTAYIVQVDGLLLPDVPGADETSPAAFIDRPGSIRAHVAGVGAVTLVTTGGGGNATIALTGISTGTHRMAIIGSGDALVFGMNDDAGGVTQPSTLFTDSSNDWTWVSTYAAIYVDEVSLYELRTADAFVAITGDQFNRGTLVNASVTATGDVVLTGATTGSFTTPVVTADIPELVYSTVVWEIDSAASTTVAVEVNTGSGWTTGGVINGAAIPAALADTGDNINGTGFRVRVSFNRSSGQAAPYLRSIAFAMAGTGDRLASYRLTGTPGFQITDQGPNTNVAAFYQPSIQSGDTLQVTVAGFVAPLPDVSGADSFPDAAAEITTLTNYTTTVETGDHLPLFGFLNVGAVQGDVPIRFLWVLLFGVVLFFVAVFTWMAFKNLIYVSVAMGFVLLALVLMGSGLLPMWTVIVFGILAAGIVLLVRQGALTP